MLNSKKYLFIIELPPPMHGMTYINKIIYENYNSKKNFFFNKVQFTKNLKENNVRSLKKIFRNFRLILKSWSKYIGLSIDVIYIPISHSKFGILRDLILVLPFLFKKKILHIHGFTIFKVWKDSRLFRSIFKIISFNASLVALCEEHSIQLSKITKQSIHVLPNCLNNEKNKTVEPKFISKNIKLLYLSNISQDKGIFEVLKILKDNKNIHLTIAGKILDSEYDFNKTINSLKSQVTYLGFVNEKEKEEVFRKNDIFILPSNLEEGAPVSIIESMSYGIPIISSNKGCIPNMIRNAGYVLSNPKDEKEILIGINDIIHKYSYYSKEAKKNFESNYSKEEFIKKLDRIITNGV